MALSSLQRVFLIREIAKRLSIEEYPLIDLTLKEFDLPWADSWQGSKHDYVMAMLEKQSDKKLIGVGKHLGYDVEETDVSFLDLPFWEKGKLKVFLSHLAKEKVWTADLQQALSEFGITSFVAHKDVKPTSKWQDQIELALSTCDALVAVLHKEFHASKWTDQEIGFAMGRRVPVCSIRLGEDPYGFIGTFQAFQGGGKEPQEVARELFDAYRANKQTQLKMREVVLRMFIESRSFADAKTRIKYLEELESWGPDFADQIRTATESNSQILGSWGVPGRVEMLAKKWEIGEITSPIHH